LAQWFSRIQYCNLIVHKFVPVPARSTRARKKRNAFRIFFVQDVRVSKPGIKPGTLASTGFSSSIYFYFFRSWWITTKLIPRIPLAGCQILQAFLEPCSISSLRKTFSTVTDDINRGTGTYWHIPIPNIKIEVANFLTVLAVLYYCVRANTLYVDLF